MDSGCVPEFTLSTDCILATAEVLLDTNRVTNNEEVVRAVHDPIEYSMNESNFLDQVGYEELKEVMFMQETYVPLGAEADLVSGVPSSLETTVITVVVIGSFVFIITLLFVRGRARRERESEPSETRLGSLNSYEVDVSLSDLEDGNDNNREENMIFDNEDESRNGDNDESIVFESNKENISGFLVTIDDNESITRPEEHHLEAPNHNLESSLPAKFNFGPSDGISITTPRSSSPLPDELSYDPSIRESKLANETSNISVEVGNTSASSNSNAAPTDENSQKTSIFDFFNCE